MSDDIQIFITLNFIVSGTAPFLAICPYIPPVLFEVLTRITTGTLPRLVTEIPPRNDPKISYRIVSGIIVQLFL